MNELTVKIVMILFPGIITTMVLDKIIEHKPWNNFKYMLFIIFYGVISYSLLQITYIVSHFFEVGRMGFNMQNVKVLSVWDFNNSTTLPYQEVIEAGIVSLLIAFLVSFINDKEWINFILMKFKITGKYGEYSTNYQLLKELKGQWFDITIWDKNLTIRGKVISINESNNLCELLIYDAEVFKLSPHDDIKNLYMVDYISISEPHSNLLISTTQKIGDINDQKTNTKQ